MTTLILVRHGETALNVERRYQGRIDPPLNERGAEQACRLASLVEREIAAAGAGRTTEVHASPSQRTLTTAALAARAFHPRLDSRLRELDFGAFDGRTHEENLSAHGDLFRAWISDPRDVRPPGGETLDELEARVAGWLEALPGEGCVVAFTHGGPIRAALGLLQGVPFTDTWRYATDPGEAVRLTLLTRPRELVAPPIRLGEGDSAMGWRADVARTQR
jgi:broad specificity phosphatase PhoE